MRVSLRWWIPAAIFACALVGVGVMLALNARGITREVRAGSMEHLRMALQMHQGVIESALAHGDEAELQARIMELASMPRIRRALLIDTRGEVVASARASDRGQSLESLAATQLLAERTQALRVIEESLGRNAITIEGGRGGSLMLGACPVRRVGGESDAPVMEPFGALLLVYDFEAARNAAMDNLLAATMQVGFLGLLVSLALTAVLERGVVSRVKRLAHAAHRFGKGETVKIPHDGIDDELRALGLSLSRMMNHRSGMEATLRASHQRYRDLYEEAPVAFINFGPDGSIVRSNALASALTGRPAMELFTCSMDDLFLFEPGNTLTREQLLEALGDSHALVDGEVRLRPAVGAPRWVRLTARPEVDESGALVECRTAFVDVTKQHVLQEQLNHAQRLEAIGTLAGGIAHDFNNILQGVTLSAELAREDVPEHRDEHIGRVLDGCQRAAVLVDQMLTFGRRTQSAKRPVQLQALTPRVLDFLRHSLPPHIALDSALEASCPPVMADENQLQQVLVNLCVNATHALDQAEGVITVTVRRMPAARGLGRSAAPLGTVRLSVADTGPGIAPKVLPHIFEPYFTTKQTQDGTGLGLAVVHGIVTAHQGTITVDTALGKGTRFDILLPACAVEEHEAPAEPDSFSEPQAGMRILLVDDDVAIGRSLRMVLERKGYSVSYYDDGLAACAAFREEPCAFDAVITDLTMPEKSGLDVARVVRALRPEAPVLLITGNGANESPESIHAAGVTECLAKPLSVEVLMRTLSRHLPQAAGS